MIELSGAASVLAFLFVVVVLFQLRVIEKRVRALSRLDAKLNALMRHSGVEFDPYKDLPASVVDALQRGNKFEAIKHYKESTGASLMEAKEFIEEIQRRAGVPV